MPRRFGAILTTTALLMGGAAACGGEQDPSGVEIESMLKDANQPIGVVPGIVSVAETGEHIARPIAGVNGKLACAGGDGELHDDATEVYYQQADGDFVKVDAEDVVAPELANEEQRALDAKSSDLILRQCITAEGRVEDLEGGGFCVPIGEPDPNEPRIVVAADVSKITARSGAQLNDLMTANC